MRNKALLLCIVWLLLISCSPLKDYNVKDRKWAFPEIEAFERLDKTQSYAEDAILFIGSSSIRLWKTLIEDMKPYSVIQRGYGGAHFRDMVFFTDRIMFYLQKDLIQLLVICFLIILFIYYISFRAKRAVILPMSVVVFGTIWCLGTVALLGYELTHPSLYCESRQMSPSLLKKLILIAGQLSRPCCVIY